MTQKKAALQLSEKGNSEKSEILDGEFGPDGAGSRHGPEDEISPMQKRMEARVIRKVDCRLIPILGLLYSVAGLDRVNLSNARVAGMDEDLRFDVGNRYSIALLVFLSSTASSRCPQHFYYDLSDRRSS